MFRFVGSLCLYCPMNLKHLLFSSTKKCWKNKCCLIILHPRTVLHHSEGNKEKLVAKIELKKRQHFQTCTPNQMQDDVLKYNQRAQKHMLTKIYSVMNKRCHAVHCMQTAPVYLMFNWLSLFIFDNVLNNDIYRKLLHSELHENLHGKVSQQCLTVTYRERHTTVTCKQDTATDEYLTPYNMIRPGKFYSLIPFSMANEHKQA